MIAISMFRKWTRSKKVEIMKSIHKNGYCERLSLLP
jgi:hypothetical protein